MSEEKKDALSKVLEGIKAPEDQLKAALDFMRAALNQEGSPRLRDFWSAKTLCLPLFKQRISPAARAFFWDEFVELSNEARKLKEVLDEQSAFASEQIDKAIHAVEKDLENFPELMEQLNPKQLFPQQCDALSDPDLYESLFRELSLLTTFSSRISSLKQEVIKTSMRVRQKGRIFEKLQTLREKVLPRRKNIVDQLSQTFIKDVENFVEANSTKSPKPFYALREEIKALQELSKTLCISTSAFTKTREALSVFWDKIRILDKDRKKGLAEKKNTQKDNHDGALLKIEALEKRIEEEKLKADQIKPLTAELYTYLRSLDLHRDQVKELKSRLKDLECVSPSSQPVIEDKALQEKLQQDQLLEQVEKALNDLKEASSSAIQKAIEQFASSDALDPLYDLHLERKQSELLENEEVLVSDVEDLIMLRKEQKGRVLKRIETLRRISGAQSHDLEKAMELDEEMRTQKALVKDIDSYITQLTDLISDA